MKELNVLKFYGILLVVLGHVTFTYSPMSIISPNIPSPTLNLVKDIIYSFHMPLFFFASGCIILVSIGSEAETNDIYANV